MSDHSSQEELPPFLNKWSDRYKPVDERIKDAQNFIGIPNEIRSSIDRISNYRSSDLILNAHAINIDGLIEQVVGATFKRNSANITEEERKVTYKIGDKEISFHFESDRIVVNNQINGQNDYEFVVPRFIGDKTDFAQLDLFQARKWQNGEVVAGQIKPLNPKSTEDNLNSLNTFKSVATEALTDLIEIFHSN